MKLFASIAFVCLLHTAALAADCGDTTGPGGTRVPCACGDTVTTNTKLKTTDPVVSAGPADVCTEDGLQIGSGVTLNCNKLTIRGSGYGCDENSCFDSLGVIVKGTDESIVKNCTVTEFSTGIEVQESTGFTLQFNTIVYNGGGIGLNRGSWLGTVRDNKVGYNISGISSFGGGDIKGAGGHLITKNRIFSNEFDGINLLYFCFHNRITGNTIENNGREGVSINTYSVHEITNNHIHNNDGDGIKIGDWAASGLISHNEVSRNGKAGISVRSVGSTIVSNFGKQTLGTG